MCWCCIAALVSFRVSSARLERRARSQRVLRLPDVKPPCWTCRAIYSPAFSLSGRFLPRNDVSTAIKRPNRAYPRSVQCQPRQTGFSSIKPCSGFPQMPFAKGKPAHLAAPQNEAHGSVLPKSASRRIRWWTKNARLISSHRIGRPSTVIISHHPSLRAVIGGTDAASIGFHSFRHHFVGQPSGQFL